MENSNRKKASGKDKKYIYIYKITIKHLLLLILPVHLKFRVNTYLKGFYEKLFLCT